MPSLSELDTIRILIKFAPNFGHQVAAITGMKKLRSLGFKGTFDIWLEENIKELVEGENLARLGFPPISPWYLGVTIAFLIPKYQPITSLFQLTNRVDSGQSIEDPVLGKIRVTVLEYLVKGADYNLPPVELTLCCGDDDVEDNPSTFLRKYRTSHYIGLQPTDWKGRRFVVRPGFIFSRVSVLDPNSRLSEDERITDLSHLSAIEEKIFSLCENENCNTQLVYGIFAAKRYDILDCQIEFDRLVEAHRSLVKAEGKPTVLFLPRSYSIFGDLEENNKAKDVFFIDLTTSKIDIEKFPKNAIICAYTRSIPQRTFNKLMGPLASYPPVIEGCNSIEYCESFGLPYLMGGRMIYFSSLLKYQVPQFPEELEKHQLASMCLSIADDERGRNDKGQEYLGQLIDYMKDSKESKNREYHQARQDVHLSRPDGLKESLNLLGFTYVASEKVPSFLPKKNKI